MPTGESRRSSERSATTGSYVVSRKGDGATIHKRDGSSCTIIRRKRIAIRPSMLALRKGPRVPQVWLSSRTAFAERRLSLLV